MKSPVTRRRFFKAAAAASAAFGWLAGRKAPAAFASNAAKPAVLGGTPAHTTGWTSWPQWRESWEPAVLKVLRSCRWFRGSPGPVPEFEEAYAKLLGAKRCLATASGTTALITAMHVLGVDAGDEVIVSPYTFIASYNTILMLKALPVFADTDPTTFDMDPASIESRITDRTRAIMPVHIYGMPCDMDPILAVARKHKLAVVEDACQAWLAEYRGKKCGTLGDLGCFSFQESKHIPSGEGGAITGNSDELLDRCNSFHNCGRAYGTNRGARPYFTRGTNFRMQHFQAAILLQQIDKLVEETKIRRENADYLTAKLKEIPGIQTVRLPEGSRPVWHLYPFRYNSAEFKGLPRAKFLQALSAEGIPCWGGYEEQYYDGLIDEAIQSRGYQRLFGAERLKAYRESFKELKGNKVVCETGVCIFQNMLLGSRKDMDDIVEAIARIRAHAEEIAKL